MTIRTIFCQFLTKYSCPQIFNYFFAAIWFINGFFCKVLNLVPRHQQIVARILGSSHSRMLVVLIGISEIAMALWILSGIKQRLNAISQMAIIASMNTLEYFLAPDLLLWGKFNALYAFMLILLIGFNAFYLNKKT